MRTATTVPTETEAERLRADLETYRAYLAGPCGPECAGADHPHHRHWTNWYDRNRGVVVALNDILAGGFPRATRQEFAERVDPDEN